MTRRILFTSLLALAAGACSKKSSAATSSSWPHDPAHDQAAQIFTERCSACHGPSGDGTGPAGAALNPHPRNFHDKAWQGTVTDGHIEQIIQQGGAAVGKSPLMPPNPDLVGKTDVVTALREKVRSFGQ
jgi:mono/diheme cytochrome c family protein